MIGFLLFFYHLLGILLLPFVAAYAGIDVLRRPQGLKAYLEKFSLLLPEKKPKAGLRVWLHAVSVGEALSCEPLVRLLQKNGVSVWLSTGTETGFAASRKRYEGVDLFFFPFDFPFAVKRFLKRIDPDIVLLCELEIWPSFVWHVHKKNIPLYLINGRMVKKDFHRYYAFEWFFASIFSMFSGFFMQNDQYARRIARICRHPYVKTTGNLKFDVAPPINGSSDIEKMMPEGVVVCAVSTHRGDEQPILRAFKKVQRECLSLKLALVPRHPQRRGEIIQLLEKEGLSYTARSEGRICLTPIFLVDTIGEVMNIYKKCDIVIMGGSFSRKNGGHNIIEPALYGKCILCGNHMENFEDVYLLFKRAGALMNTSRETLPGDLQGLVANRKRILDVGERAFEVVQQNRGAAERIWREISHCIPNEPQKGGCATE